MCYKSIKHSSYWKLTYTAGFITGEIRNILQNRFGNAGRGLVFPYKVANSNSPMMFILLVMLNGMGVEIVIMKTIPI